MDGYLSRKLKANFSITLLFAKLMLCTMVAYSLARVCFLLMNQQSLEFTGSDLVFLVLHGLRFDLSILILINALFFLASIFLAFSSAQPRCHRGFKKSFVALNSLFLLTNFADMASYPFTGRRSGLEVFSYWEDLLQQSTQLFEQYWLAIALSLLFCAVYSKVCLQLKPSNFKRSGVRALTFVCFSVFALVILNRGGWQKKPLAEAHAYVWSPKHMASATLNTPLSCSEPNLLTLNENLGSKTIMRLIVPCQDMWFKPNTLVRKRKMSS